jgi:hypothetical protein
MCSPFSSMVASAKTIYSLGICQLRLGHTRSLGSGSNDFRNTQRHVNSKEILMSLSKKSSHA